MAREIGFNHVTTRGGDDGNTTLFSGERRVKADAVFHALGDLDELTSWIGVVRARHADGWTGALRGLESELYDSQTMLSRISALLACNPAAPVYARLHPVEDADIEALELREARLMNVTEIGDEFVVPGATVCSAEIDYARAVCRRCERRVVAVIRAPERPRPDLHLAQRYLNRLSDFLFVAARAAEQAAD
ncbi:MAG: cob(I)yrinic acid a,c-diamide adenosyltransferase [bacterium]